MRRVYPVDDGNGTGAVQETRANRRTDCELQRAPPAAARAPPRWPRNVRRAARPAAPAAGHARRQGGCFIPARTAPEVAARHRPRHPEDAMDATNAMEAIDHYVPKR